MATDCVFCSIAAGHTEASIVGENGHALALMDPRQFHPGHVLVIPRFHIPDVRALRPVDAEPLMLLVAATARAVDAAFPSDGLSLWHSAGAGAHQEVPHLHIHVHPRFVGDHLLRVYPSPPVMPSREVLDTRGAQIRAQMSLD